MMLTNVLICDTKGLQQIKTRCQQIGVCCREELWDFAPTGSKKMATFVISNSVCKKKLYVANCIAHNIRASAQISLPCFKKTDFSLKGPRGGEKIIFL